MYFRLGTLLKSFLLVAGLVLVPAHAFAQIGFTAGTKLEYLENPRRLPGKDEQDMRSTTALGLTLARQTKSFDTSLNYLADRQENVNDVLNDIGRIEGSGSLVWKAVPDFFSWQVNNRRSNQIIDVSEPDTPDNRQIVDITSTGPNFHLPIGSKTLANLSADFSVVGFEQSTTQEQNRNSYNFSLSRMMSRRATVSIRSSYTETSFAESFIPDYSFQNLVASLQLNSQNYQFTAEAGEYFTQRSGRDSSHPTYTLSGVYNINSRLEVSADFSRNVEDLISDINNQGAIDQFFQDSGVELGQTFGNSNAANFFERETYSFGSKYTSAANATLSLRYSKTQRASIGSLREENDERLVASTILLLPQLPRLTIDASAAYSIIDFTSEGTTQERIDLRLGASYRLTDRINLTFSAADSNQTSDLNYRNFVSQIYSIGLSFAR